MNKSRVSQVGKLKIFQLRPPEGIFHPRVHLKLNLENPTIQE